MLSMKTASLSRLQYSGMKADIDTDIISYLSPIAQSLLGKEVGEIVEIKTHGRTIKIKILSVEKGI